MMMLIEVPENVLFAEMPQDLQEAIQNVGGQFVEAMLIGTQAVDGKKLIFVDVDATAEQVEQLTNNDAFDEDGKQIAFNLGWSVVATENEPINQSVLLPYFKPIPQFEADENGDIVQVGETPVTDLTGKIQVWAGREWQY